MSGEGPSGGTGKRTRVSLSGARDDASEKRQRKELDSSVFDKELQSQLDAASDDEVQEDPEQPGNLGIDCDQEYPYVKQIVLNNFMCHNNFTVNLNPRMNFICGQNGSGKSAVSIGLSVGLGASAKDTGRAAKLKEFVGSFRNVAVITITLRQSSDKFRGLFNGEEFDQDIIIERTITSAGGSQYKLMKASKKGRIVLSTKKDDLARILQHVGIQPENPVHIMQQNHSKTFLHAGNPASYYEFFAQATRLKEYMEQVLSLLRINQNIGSLRERKEQFYTTWKETDWAEAKQQFDDSAEALKLNDELDGLYDEVVWAIAHDAKKEVDKKERELEKLNGEVTKVEEKVLACQKEASRTGQEVEEFEATIQRSRAEQKEAEAGMKQAEEAWRSAKHEHQEAESSVKGAEQEAKDLEKQIEGHRRSITQQRQEAERRRAEKKRKSGSACDIGELQADLERLKNERDSKWTEVQHLETATNLKTDTLKGAQSLQQQRQRDASEADVQVQKLLRAADTGDQLSKFKGDVEKIAPILGTAKGFERPVIGPIGKYIRIRPGMEQWTDAVASCLGFYGLQTFLVGSKADKDRCTRLLQQGKVNVKQFQCQTANYDVFSHDKLGSSHLPCVLDAIEVDASEEDKRVIMNHLIDRYRMTETRLVMDMDQAKAVINAHPETIRLQNNVRHTVKREVYLFNSTENKVDRMINDKWTSTHLDRIGGGVPKGVFAKDLTEAIRNAQEAHTRARQELRDATISANNLKGEQKEAQLAVVRVRKECSALDGRMKDVTTRLRQEQDRLREDDDDEDVHDNTEVIEREIEEIQTRLVAVVNRRELYDQEVQSKKEAVQSAATVREDRAARFREKGKAAGDLMEKFQKFSETQDKVRERLERNKEKLETKRKDVQKTQEDLQKLRDEHTELHEQATTAHEEPIETDRTKDQLLKRIDDIKRKIEKMEKALGVKKEVARSNWEKAECKDRSLLRALDDLRTKEQTISQGVKKRKRKYRAVLKTKQRLATWEFDKFAQQRDFQGRLNFCEDEKKIKKMEPIVATQKDAEGNWQELSNVKELSGGERSFSTLCMVLALSKVSQAPFLAMDEFDVFMDETNRTAGLRMLVQVLQKKKDCQTIVISPLSMAAVPAGPDISKITLEPPDRNQRTLA